MKTYKVVVERDESGAWLARVPEIRGCHTYARSLRGVDRRIREALCLWVDDADKARLELDVRLAQAAREAVRRGARSRDAAAKATVTAKKALREAVAALERAGISRRDAADLLGLSHQRIQQLSVR